MNSIADAPDLSTLILYEVLILAYVVILKLLLNSIQRLGKKYEPYRSVVDADIRRTIPADVDSAMQAYNVRSVANVIARGLVMIFAMTVIIIISAVKVGIAATIILIGIVIICLWAANRLLRQYGKTEVTAKLQKYTQMGGSNTGSILLLSIGLVVVTFILIVVQ